MERKMTDERYVEDDRAVAARTEAIHEGSDKLDTRIRGAAAKAIQVIRLMEAVERMLGEAQELGVNAGMWDENMYEWGVSLDHRSMLDCAHMQLGEIVAEEMKL